MSTAKRAGFLSPLLTDAYRNAVMNAHKDGTSSQLALALEGLANLELVSYEKGARIYMPGDPSDKIYLIRAGRVRIYFIDEVGEPQTVLELGPGELFGEIALDGGTQEFIAEALTPVEVYVLNKWQLPRLLRHPGLATRLSELLGYRRELVFFYRG